MTGGRLRARLAAGEFAVTAEIGPPRGAETESIRRKARQLRDWVDAVNSTDNQSSYVRLASWATALVCLDEGVEPVMQLTCRDRNRIALQSDLMSAAALGVPNVVLMTGDHPKFGDHAEAKPVFDLDSVQLLWVARTMRDEGRLASGSTLSPPPDYFIGAVENPFAPPLKFRAQRLGKKVEAGAQFAQTQMVFDVPAFAQWMADVRNLGLDRRCGIIAGVGVISTERGLERMRGIPGIDIPDDVASRLRGAPDFAEEGVRLAAETIGRVREMPGVAGVHVMAVGREAAVPEVLERAGLAPRAASAVGGGDAR